MRISILACILSAVAAICLYAVVAHVLAARHRWFRTVHLTFAALAFMAAAHAVAHIAVYSAQDVQSYVRASSYSNVSGALVMAILPWLIQGYFDVGSKVAPSLMSAFYVLSGAINEFARLGSAMKPVPMLQQIVLPWGELATIHHVATPTLPLLIFWGATTLLIGYITQLAVRKRRRGGRRQTIAMIVSLAILVLALGGNLLVLTGRLDSVFLGEFGFLALVLTMMRLLSGEESYRAIIAQASAGIFVVASTGRLLDVNRTGRAMVGCTRAELRGLTMADMFVGGQPAPLQPGHETDRASHGLQRLRRKDGTIVLADLSTQMLSDGRMLYIARDVTETQRADGAIRLLAESAPDTDPVRFYSRCAWSLSEAFDAKCALIGMLDPTREHVRVVGRWPEEAKPSQYRASGAPISTLSRASKTLSTPDARVDFASHAEFDAATKGYLGTAIVSPAGEVIGIVEVWDKRPLTVSAESQRIIEMFANRIGTEMSRIATESELRQLTATLEARITARTAELAQVNEELEAFSYSVSHDLRTPVRAIDAYASLLRESLAGQSDALAGNHVERIAEAARRMRQLIDGLLTLARLSHQHQDIQEVVMSTLAQQAIELLRDKDRSRRVEFTCAPNVIAFADPTGANIVLTNLLENAWKYSSRADHARIEFGCRPNGAESVYFVSDNGVGFDMQHAKHMFEPFRRLHSHNDFPGSGVGLATVHRIVKRHNGRIWAESAKGHGATFFFTLRSPAQASVGAAPREVGHG